MDQETIVTLNDLTSFDSTEKVCRHINKHDAVKSLELMATQYRRHLKRGGGSINLFKMIEVIGDGIAARELEEWLLETM